MTGRAPVHVDFVSYCRHPARKPRQNKADGASRDGVATRFSRLPLAPPRLASQRKILPKETSPEGSPGIIENDDPQRISNLSTTHAVRPERDLEIVNEAALTISCLDSHPPCENGDYGYIDFLVNQYGHFIQPSVPILCAESVH
ncbi:hypothetical protein GCM10010218_35300 [Streptomyces mashuensis]|uniref:Uncharacterized protein n=1 Tax=Streptomyces mashuensis TaxID=33904 RepID=A0A919EE43_9ACTN|nr:hypothetical protein GCM10010218_35300 [Streptomyces mashuensis]